MRHTARKLRFNAFVFIQPRHILRRIILNKPYIQVHEEMSHCSCQTMDQQAFLGVYLYTFRQVGYTSSIYKR